MRFNRGRLALVVVALAGCAVDGLSAPDSGDPGPTGSGTGRSQPEYPVFSGVSQLETLWPSRCERLEGRAPEFSWQRPDGAPGTGQDRVFAAVFAAPPVVIDKSVSNTESGVWWWSTGLSRSTGQGRDGSVRWSEGRGFASGQPADVPAPTPAPGVWHYFAVWAWNPARELVMAGEVRAFCPGGDCDCRAVADDTAVQERFCLPLPKPPQGDRPGCVSFP